MLKPGDLVRTKYDPAVNVPAAPADLPPGEVELLSFPHDWTNEGSKVKPNQLCIVLAVIDTWAMVMCAETMRYGWSFTRAFEEA